ncbi:MAG: alpha-L-arabinofuranosidase [Ruminococcaceae bacterium]|nr:alpha-L-arabinofuranosidase [Oscillospiraceae bacterium]MBE6902570.1 alpha-L-arabinofuranosidase [Oscillospiraceae bacterium]
MYSRKFMMHRRNAMKRKVISCIISAAVITSSCGCSGNTPTSSEEQLTSENTSTSTTSETTSSTQPVDDTPAVTPADVSLDGQVRVSPLNASTTNGGSFEGWGTSLCWWANRIGYSDSLSQQAADLFYGDDGLDLNIMRYNIGGGDDPTHHHITRTDSAVPGWLVLDEATGEFVYDYTADAGQLNVLKRCAEASGEDAWVEVFSNSPPYFMTVSGCSSGNTDASVNNIKDECYGDVGEYLAHVSAYINNELGVKVDSISPMNEANTNHWGAFSNKQEGCHVDAGESQSTLIIETANAMERYGLGDVLVIASDETAPDKQVEEYKTFSAEALEKIDRISTHTYGTNGIEELGALAKKEGFNLWMSEVDGSGTAGEEAGEMGAALWFAQKIIYDINKLSPSAWVMWQVIDSHISIEGYNGNKDSGMPDITGGFWGTAVADHDNDTIILTQKYYGFGQFTRYIRPGATLIHCDDNTLAAYDKDKGELVIVAVNPYADDKTYNFDLSQFTALGENVDVTRTSGDSASGEQWAQLDSIKAHSEGFVAELKGNSITTFVMKGVQMGDVSVSEISLENATVEAPAGIDGSSAESVIDGDMVTYYDGDVDSYIIIDLGADTEFDIIGYTAVQGQESKMQRCRFHGSTDGENWEQLTILRADPLSGEMNELILPNTVNYRYLKFDYPKSTEKRIFGCCIAEIALYKID